MVQRRLATHGRNADPQDCLCGGLQAEARNWRATRMRPVYSDAFTHPDRAAAYGLDRTYVIEVPAGTDTEAMAAAYARFGDDIEIATVDTIGGVADLFPNDPSFNVQYALHNTGQSGGVPDADIDAPAAWAMHTGDLGTVTIAIIDSGVNSHPDYGTNYPSPLSGRIVPGTNTNNPLVPYLTSDGCPHGTHVTGIAAASGNNSIGIAGVSWGAYIMPVRILNGCAGTVSQLTAGIRWAADHGADIGNMSLQYYGLSVAESNLLQDAIDYSRDAGMLLIAAAGNGQPGVVAYPARLPNCMAVSATNNDDVLCTTAICGFNSNFGNEVDVCAPGDDIYSTWTSGSYILNQGTSMAAPHVSGLAALMKSFNPNLTVDDLELLLTASVDDKGPVGWDNQYGYGRINAHSALTAVCGRAGFIRSSTPLPESIDARKPTDRDGTNAYGWQSVELLMGACPHFQTEDDFVVDQEGGVAGFPRVAEVNDLGENHVEVLLDRMIEPKAWTTIAHVGRGIAVRLGFLPGDVNADTGVDSRDVTTLLDALNGIGVSRPIWSLDLDRSEAFTAADLLEMIDLSNGADSYEAYYGTVLP